MTDAVKKTLATPVHQIKTGLNEGMPSLKRFLVFTIFSDAKSFIDKWVFFARKVRKKLTHFKQLPSEKNIKY